jgi:mannose-6-phosphate isomerase class I
LERHQEGSIEAFAYFLEKTGIHRGDFVVVDSQTVHPLIYEWFELLGVMLKDFTALVVFQNRASMSDG